MPQLNPEPWFQMLMLSWLIFLTLLPMKVMAYKFPHDPVAPEKKHKPTPWTWPWH
uniref:ATP synthase complex subunit 8 n=1 Tax=Sillago sp. 1 SS-2021 TaxID=2879623 RepID=A0A8K1UDW2_9TELE|nr:ATP synthase F0 subunit 8 [Sillago sp. 1 SS-2021]